MQFMGAWNGSAICETRFQKFIFVVIFLSIFVQNSNIFLKESRLAQLNNSNAVNI